MTPTTSSPAVTPTMPRKEWREASAPAALPNEAAVAIAEGGEHVKHDLLVWFEILELGEISTQITVQLLPRILEKKNYMHIK